MAIFHRSRFGNFSTYFVADVEGYVATSAKEARALRWPANLTAQDAREIASENRVAQRRATADLRAWAAGR